MSLLRRLLVRIAPRPAGRERYGAEVLFANWVELPQGFREIIARR
jgi:hypothetical protein